MSYNITVGSKPSSHPFYNRGSKYCYYIDGIAGKEVELVPGNKYIFNINAPGHPFYFTTSEIGGSEDNNILEGFPPTDQGSVEFTVTNSYPDKFYYQCKIHSYMGGVSVLTHNTFYIRPILSGLTAPTSLSAPNGDMDNIYVADQIGIVYKYNLMTNEASIFLDVREYTPKLNPNYDERGLLGLCFHPLFVQNGRFFIYYSSIRQYTEESKGYYNCLSEFIYRNGTILYNGEKILLRINRDLPNHNGGKIGFGPDGYLYLTIGDGGPQKDPNGNAQNLSTWLGKILRIDVNKQSIDRNGTPLYYAIPQDNPFINVRGALPEIWAYGFRNPWGLEFINDGLIVTDAGYESGTGQEEVNYVIRGGNYGWNIKEGSKLASFHNTNIRSQINNMIDPIFAYTTSDPEYSDSEVSTIVGGYLTDQGDYICADYSGRLIRLRFNQEGVQVIETAKVGKWILSFGKTNGKLYILTSEVSGPKGNTGEIYELTVV